MAMTSMSSTWFQVTDWDAAKRFYTEGLGLRPGPCDDAAGWAAFHTTEKSPPVFLIRAGSDPDVLGAAVVGFHSDLSEETEADAMERIEQFGGRVDEAVQEGPDVRIRTVYDPDGNRLEINVRS